MLVIEVIKQWILENPDPKIDSVVNTGELLLLLSFRFLNLEKQ